MFETLIGTSYILGQMIGALMGGKIIQYGRRFTHYLCCGIGIFGAFLTLIQYVECLIVGRTIFGFAAGI